MTTDDTVMTMAVAAAILQTKLELGRGDQGSEADLLRAACRILAGSSLAAATAGILHCGSTRRIPSHMAALATAAPCAFPPCGWAGRSEEEVRNLATWVSEPTHDHPEGIQGAVATALAIYYARTGVDKDELRRRLGEMYDLDFTLDEIRATYEFNETCQETVPQALVAFFESESYEDALRCAVSIGGDSDTVAAISGSIAEAYYGIPQSVQDEILSYFYNDHVELLLNTLIEFNREYGEH